MDILEKKGIFLEQKKEKSSFFSVLNTRFFFLLLLIADFVWLVLLLCKISLCGFLQILCMGSSSVLQRALLKSWIALKRAVVCGLSLCVSFFSPSFGMMIGCAYFLMYDKRGIEEVIPKSLQEQFKEIISAHQEKDQIIS